MKKLALILALVLATIAAPAGAASKEVIGPVISPLTGHPTTFAADSPFHVANCWALPAGTPATGHYSIALSVDGTLVEPSFTEFGSTDANPDVVRRCYVWNFASGLSAGTHTFVLTWYVPCSATSQTCSNPNEVVTYTTYTLTVTFV
jgi:hypothetical protein